ncbi:MAG: DUF87 domain-containing protein [Candidatus Micrarchaeaceae archaeon]|jgi:hypothetical protein
MNIIKSSNSKIASGMVYLENMSEPSYPNGEGVYIGRSNLYRIPFLLDFEKLINKNMAIIGMSGSGKSYFLKSFIIRSNLKKSSSVLIIDWNNEYKNVVSFLNGKTLTLGKNLMINLFDLYDLKNTKNIRSICDLMNYSLNLNQDEGYFLYSKILSLKSKNYLNLSLLISEFKNDKKETSDRIASKLMQLKHSPMFSDATDFQMNELIYNVISIDFSMLRDDSQRNEIAKSMLKIIIEIMHNVDLNSISKQNERIIVLDEAWRLIKNSEDVGILFREGRKYGFCVAVATQLVNDINNEVLSNAASIFIFRLQNDTDFKTLIDSGIINQKEKNYISTLPIGSCFVSMAIKENNKTNKFFIKSIDGISTSIYNIRSGKMQNKISNRVFLESTKALIVSDNIKEKVVNFIEENNNEIDDVQLVELMIKLKIERSEIIYYLRKMGLKDIQIIKAYDYAFCRCIANVRFKK